MTKFLIEVDYKDSILFDFQFHLLQAIKYDTWLSNGEANFDYFNMSPNDLLYTNYNSSKELQEAIPVGSVRFVHNFIKAVYDFEPKPLNVPKCLLPFAGREIYTRDNTWEKYYYVKSNDVVKHECNGFYYRDKRLPVGSYQYSEELKDIGGEWRVFVFNNEIVGINNYNGDFASYPNNKIGIHQMVEAMKEMKLPAYTLDVAVTKSGFIYVMEVHNFYSCGLYGFQDYRVLLAMFIRSFNNVVTKNLSKEDLEKNKPPRICKSNHCYNIVEQDDEDICDACIADRKSVIGV